MKNHHIVNKKYFHAIVLTVLAAISLFVFINFYDQASPQAAIDVRLTKDDAQNIAQDFLKQNQLDVSGYTLSTTFGSDDESATYLQKTLGLEKANEVMQNEVSTYGWSFRAFRPLEKEEFSLSINPTYGKIVAFSHQIEDDKNGANLTQEQAQIIAEQFVSTIGNKNLANYELVDASEQKQKNRTDHYFQWKVKDHVIGEAEVRLAVNVFGDQVGKYLEYLKVPEAFSRGYIEQSSGGDLLALISQALAFVIFIAAAVIFIRRYKVSKLNWKFGIGFASVLLFVSVLDMINSIPLIRSVYTTDTSYVTYWGTAIISTLISLIIYSIFILVTGASGESLAEEVYPHSIKNVNNLIRGKVFSREFARSSLAGYALGFISLGYITIFYLVGTTYFGVWQQAQGPFDNILNTVFPFAGALLTGIVAAVSEEFVFRLFAISFFKKYFKSTFLALLIPALIWAFGHSNYPVFPVYVRGIELTIAGLIFGYFFIKFDLWTCLVGHFVIDTVLVAMPLLRSSNPYYIISGLVVIGLGLIPVILVIFGFKDSKLKQTIPIS